ncbi:hypothetical protein AVEN_66835-1 [Araneus ventricosus]|uniref:Uncharacterized protein n=1 Tax=Araneus ventricosus TaxID=182803 RepID=A0A4Y2DR33_ARAVE|nr:hypothetical protein AVEN_66835-1 [Araneus ventricosus]
MQQKFARTPSVLLGMRSAVKNDIQVTCAELVHDATIRLPSDLFSSGKISTTCNTTYVSLLRDKMRSLQPVPTSNHGKSSVFIPTTLKSCSDVSLKVESIQTPLSQAYIGPHEVVNRSDKVFTILINGKKTTVSIDRVKPAFMLDNDNDIPSVPEMPRQQSDRTEITIKFQ